MAIHFLRRAITIGVTLLVSFATTAAAAQAWTRPAGEVYLNLAYDVTTATDQFAHDGTIQSYADERVRRAYLERSMLLRAELGVIDELTVVVATPYRQIDTRDGSSRYRVRRLGDLTLGARWQFGRLLSALPGNAALSFNALTTLPTGYTRNHIPTPGSGQVDLMASLDFGYSFWEIGVYLQTSVGLRVRTSSYGLSRTTPCAVEPETRCFSDLQPDLGEEMVARFEAGFRPTDWLLVQTLNEAVISFAPPEPGFSVRNPVPTRRRSLQTGLGLGVYPLRELGFYVQSFLTPWGQNTLRSVDLVLGIEAALDTRRL